MITYRKLHQGEGQKFWNLMNQLDQETKYMLYEPGERKKKATNIDRLENLIQEVEIDHDFLMVAEDGDELVGYLSANRERLNRVAHTAYIVTGILASHRNQGIGSTFFKKLDEWAIEKGLHRLELTVVCENEMAHHLYTKMGFQVEGVKKDSICLDGNYLDEYYMGKLLGGN